MKAFRRILVIAAFVLAYAVLLGLGGECLLCLLGGAMAVSPDGVGAAAYPRFLPFCAAAGILTLCALIGLGILNAKAGRRMDYTRPAWVAQWVCVCAAFLPAVYLWEQVLRTAQQVL